MTGSKSVSSTINGITSIRSVLPYGDGLVTKERSLPPAKTGALTVRTSSTVGTITGQASHGVVTGNRLDVYWVGGSRIGVLVGTVDTLSIPFSGGSGDALPITNALLTLMVPVKESFPLVVAAVSSLICVCDVPGIAAVVDVTEAALGSFRPTGPFNGTEWESSLGVTNPVSANSTDVFLSHSDALLTRQIQILALVG